MEFYLRSLLIRRSVLGNEHRDVATTLNNIGRIHFAYGEYDEAHDIYTEALRQRRAILGSDHLDVVASIYNLGQTHHKR
eukprot:12609165-Ditylum_brightwellii.AAC.1